MERYIFNEYETYNYRSFPLMLGAWDFFQFDEKVMSLLPSDDATISDSVYHDLIKSLILQLTDSCYGTLTDTQDYFSETPVSLMFKKAKQPSIFSSESLAKALDTVYKIGPDKLLAAGAKAVFEALNINPTTTYINATSFIYDGGAGDDVCCMLRLKDDYSSALSPELNQITHIQVVDDICGIPVCAIPCIGNVIDLAKDLANDDSSYNELIAQRIRLHNDVCKSLEMLVGDTLLCSKTIFDESKRKGLHLITRVPESFSITKECFKILEQVDLTPVKPSIKTKEQYMGCWINGVDIFDHPVKLLAIKNTSINDRIETKIRRDAEREKGLLQKQLVKINKSHYAS